MANKLSEEISRIINPDSGIAVPLTEDNKRFISEYRKRFSEVSGEEHDLILKNVIVKEGQCGFLGDGAVDYLLNTDAGNRYRVTVRTSWTDGLFNSGQHDQIYITEAGGKQSLGCSHSSNLPVVTYSRQVVGEVRIET